MDDIEGWAPKSALAGASPEDLAWRLGEASTAATGLFTSWDGLGPSKSSTRSAGGDRSDSPN